MTIESREMLLAKIGPHANLSYANLTGANLTGANLTGANLTDANLSGEKFDETTIWPDRYAPPKMEME